MDYDDDDYFFLNPNVLGGLTWDNIKWAFTSGEYQNWHPLTWLSLMLDATFFGNGAAAPHLTNVLWHAANSMLVFLLFRRMTGAFWRSAVLAVLFAIHPLHVESVAWVSERKDVLSGFFGLLTLLCYAGYAAEDRNLGSEQGAQKSFFSSRYYWLALLFFACGLMSKPMLVTLPFVLLLVDFWPLERLQASSLRRLLIEKIPFVLLTVGSSIVTFIAQHSGGAVTSLAAFPMDARVENAFVSYARYLSKTFCPIRLTGIYPHPIYWPMKYVILSVALFIVLCAVAIVARKKFPWVFTGWFWFVGMLVPVIGLLQVGSQAMADRYMYLPLIGILIIVVWGASEIYVRWHLPQGAVIFPTAIVFLALGLRARDQVHTWRDDPTFFGYALSITKHNFIADLDYGFWCSRHGQQMEAMKYYYDAYSCYPDDPTALYNVANAFAKLGHWDEAIKDYRRALQIVPDQPDIMNNLGLALAERKQWSEAIPYFEGALKKRPNFPDADNDLGTALFIQGNYVEAAKHFYSAFQNEPDNPVFAVNLGDTLVRMGQKAAAAECYQEALKLEPDNKTVQAKLQALGPQPAN